MLPRDLAIPPDWAKLDTAAFGVARDRLWSALLHRDLVARCVKAEDGSVVAVGMSRPGARARYLGPVVARSPLEGLALIDALLAESSGQPFFWDIPDPNTAAVASAQAHGFQRQRPLTRMFLGRDPVGGDPRLQFALAGPEVG